MGVKYYPVSGLTPHVSESPHIQPRWTTRTNYNSHVLNRGQLKSRYSCGRGRFAPLAGCRSETASRQPLLQRSAQGAVRMDSPSGASWLAGLQSPSDGEFHSSAEIELPGIKVRTPALRCVFAPPSSSRTSSPSTMTTKSTDTVRCIGVVAPGPKLPWRKFTPPGTTG